LYLWQLAAVEVLAGFLGCKVTHIARELNLSRQTVYEVLNGR
jgi:hypothetical protein